MEKVIQEGSAETEKLLKENPSELKSPMYLVGKIGDREIRVLAKNGEIMVSDEKTKTPEPAEPSATVEPAAPLENEPKNIVESIPAAISTEEQNIPAAETNPPEVKNDGPEPGQKSEPEPEPAAGTGADSGVTVITAGLSAETGGQVPPPDKRPGENGTGAESPEKRDDGGAGVPGDGHNQGGILQVDAGGRQIDEGLAGAEKPGTESVAPCGGQGGVVKTPKEEPGTGEGKTETGIQVPDSEPADRMAGTGAGG
jgi:hypothetical protein